MPHKRSKKSIRDSTKASKGQDLAPTASSLKIDQTVSKTFSRILNAESIRRDFNERKRKRSVVGESSTGAGEANQGADGDKRPKKPKLNPAESLKSFYQRVETEYRGSTREEIKRVANRGKKERRKVKAEKKQKEEEEEKKKKEAKENSTWRRSDKKLPGGIFIPKSISTSKDEEDSESEEGEDSKKGKGKEIKEFKKAERIRLHDVVAAPPKLPRLKGAESLGSETTSTFRLPIAMAVEELEKEREHAIRRYRELKESRMSSAVDTSRIA